MLDRKLGGFISANPPAPTQASAQGVWDGNQQIVAQLQNAWPLPPNVVQRSLRFNSADSAYLNRTPASGNRRTWIWSCWFKLGITADANFRAFLEAFTGSNNVYCSVAYTNGSIYLTQDNGSGGVMTVYTAPVYRDPSAWYHLVLAVDTTNGTPANTVRIYINGAQQSVAGSYPATNLDTWVNSANPHRIGARWSGPNSTSNFDGYMTEVNFVDGYPNGFNQSTFASTNIATLFGETDPQTGIWVPKRYTGTYGTNGFRLPFSNNSSTTALGFDASGNGNNFTPNNFSVTPGSGNDSLLDVPSLYGATDTGIGGEVRGNYCTLNPLVQNGFWAAPTRGNLTNGNLDFSVSATDGSAFSTWDVPTDLKIYFEVTAGTVSSASTVMLAASSRTTFEVGYYANATRQINGSTPVSYGSSWTTGDVIGVAVDRSTNAITFYKNGVSQGTITNTFPSQPVLMGGYLVTGQSLSYNFGQRPFAFPAPAGFKALCTTNFVAPAIGQTAANQADNHFNVVTYIGNGTAQTITGVGFQPDLVWIKNRDASGENHRLIDSVRGATKVLYSSLSNTEDPNNTDTLTAFTADGFSVGNNSAVNGNTNKVVAWCWNAGGTTVTNNAGTNGASIASTYRANRAAGFSVVTYTGNGVDGATVAHGLGAAPAFIIVKSRSNAFNWGVWHKNLAKYDANHAYAIGLNLTRPADATAQYAVFYPGVNTANVFGLGNESTANQSNATYVAYCFAEVPGFSGFGSYTGNGSPDGPFVHLGFRPAFMLLKNISQAYGWQIYDSKRNPTNRVNLGLYPNVSNGEGTEAGAGPIDFLSNGFKIRDATWDELNGSTRTYLYIAFAEAPFRLSSAR